MRNLIPAVLAATLCLSLPASAQLDPYTDYTVSDYVWIATTVKVHPNMGDDYLEGIRKTWAESNEVAKKLGHIEDWKIMVSDFPVSGDFNMLLMIKLKNTSDLAPSKKRYDEFMKAWGDANEANSRETTKNYPGMRELTGEYLLRDLTFVKK